MIVWRTLPAVAAVLLAPTLCGCHTPPPPPPPPPPPLPVPPAWVPPPPQVVSGRWSFAITGVACLAHVYGRNLSVQLRVGGARVELSVAGPAVRSAAAHAGRRGHIRFEGVSAWVLPARSSGHRAVVAVEHLNETRADQVLALLSGGRLSTEVGRAHVPVLRVPDSDVAGRDWFDCVRNQIPRSVLRS